MLTVISDNRGHWLQTVALTGDNQAKGDALVEAIFDCKVAMETKDVPTDNLYGVFSPENYYLIIKVPRLLTPISTVIQPLMELLLKAAPCMWLASRCIPQSRCSARVHHWLAT